ncbi:MAG: YciI family protein, partial [Mesorhizobium sp.]
MSRPEARGQDWACMSRTATVLGSGSK